MFATHGVKDSTNYIFENSQKHLKKIAKLKKDDEKM